MNIVYKYENLDKKSGARYYIGSKSECALKHLSDGTAVVFSNSLGKEYFGSSSNPEMKEDLAEGHRFTASILEEVGTRGDLREREKYYLEEVDAARDPDYYNLSNNTLSCSAHNVNLDIPINCIGETWKIYASRKSGTSKRDALAEKLGYPNFVSLYLSWWDRHKNGEAAIDISAEIGKNRHYVTRIFSEVDLDEIAFEVEKHKNDSELIEKLRYMVGRDISLQGIAEHVGIHYYTCRYLVGNYYQQKSRKTQNGLRGNRNSALVNEMTEEEYEQNIIGLWVEGESVKEVAKLCNASTPTVIRILKAYLRKTVQVKDLPHFKGVEFWEEKAKRREGRGIDPKRFTKSKRKPLDTQTQP